MTLDKKIQMVDLVGQYQEIEGDIQSAIKGVIYSSAFINGPEVWEFADELKEYTGAGFVVPCANGTDALQVALMALDPELGDEVIVPAFTYVATVEVIALLGLKPVFVDVDPGTFNIDPGLIEPAITPRTKAIMAVNLFGQCAEMETISLIAGRNDISVIEDNAQTIGADYYFADGSSQKSGTMGDIGTTSFFPSKNLGCYGDGGAIFTNDQSLGEKIKMICNHGQKKKYYHDCLGVNSRLDSLQAAILRQKLRKLDEYASRRQSVAEYYDQRFSSGQGLQVPTRSSFSSHVFHQYTLLVDGASRQDLMNHLKELGVPSMVYYPLPIHLQKAYLHFGHNEGDFPISEDICRQVISLPIHTQMDDEQSAYIADSVLSFFRN